MKASYPILYPISHDYAKLIVQRGIRALSYSMITKANNEQEVIDYIERKEIVGVHFSYGKQAHSAIGGEDFQHPADTKSYIDADNNVFLSYHQISETMLMKLAIENHKHYRIKHLDRLEYEKKMYVIIKFGEHEFLCKSFIDAYNNDLNTIVEFKTTSTLFNIDSSIDKYNYDLQAYIYRKIIKSHFNVDPNFEFFFLNKNDNHEVSCLPADSYIMQCGKNKLLTFFPKIVDILIKHKYLKLFKIN